MEIKPEVLTLQKLVAGRLFRIPQYQRAYSWTTQERKDLFADIRRLYARPGSSHFMATIVALRREAKMILITEYSVVDVVDGQQRLTTLIVLLKAIELALAKATGPESREIARQLSATLVKGDDLALVLLRTNHDSSEYYVNYVRKGVHPAIAEARTIADREMLRAIEECEEFVSEWCAEGRTLVDLVALLHNRLYFLFHEIADESLVYSVFEVLNSRGLPVSPLDRLKSTLMGIAFEAAAGNADENIAELHAIWQEVYRAIGLRQGVSTEALRFSATLEIEDQPSKPLGEEESVAVLQRLAGNTASGAVKVSNWVLAVTRAVDQLRADRRHDAITAIAQARLLATAVLLREDFDKEERHRALEHWERVTFRIFGMHRRDARTKVGDYTRLAWHCRQERPSFQKLTFDIRKLADDPNEDYSIEASVEKMRDADCYTEWQPELRYLLFRYEQHLSEKNGQKFENEQWARIWADTPAKSIEHIRPQSWGPVMRSDTGLFVHRLGNLLLLPPGVNSSLSNRPPSEKVDKYVKTGLLIARDVVERLPSWDRPAAIQRENEILDWARAEWGDREDEE